jgi:uncharacterized protein (TIGR02266 family)
MSEQQRVQERRAERIIVKFGTQKLNNLGFVTNVSRGGLGIKAHGAYPKGTVLMVAMDVTAGRTIKLVGEVRWMRDFSHLPTQRGLKEMGIKLLDESPEYQSYLRERIGRESDRRVHERFQDAMEVVFDDPKDLLKQYGENISEGGFYLRSDRPLAEGDRIKVRLVIPDLMDAIHAEAEVVRLEVLLEDTGVAYGLGVKFVDVPAEDEKRLNGYIEKLRTLLTFE